MNQEIITFADIKIKERRFHRYKNPIFLEDVDIENILIRLLLVREIINFLLGTRIMIIKLNYSV